MTINFTTKLLNIKLKPRGSGCIENELLYRYCDQRKNILKIFYYYCAISGPTILIIRQVFMKITQSSEIVKTETFTITLVLFLVVY